MFNISFSAPGNFAVSFSAPQSMEAKFENTTILPIGQYYTGEYEITPTEETQILQTERLISAHNFVINPIPSNYGLITWNGATLTVS